MIWKKISEAPFANMVDIQPLDCLVYSKKIGGVRHGRVWSYFDGECVGQAYGYSGEWEITHFMEMPEPPND